MPSTTPETVLVLAQNGFFSQQTAKVIESLRYDGYMVRVCDENELGVAGAADEFSELFDGIERVLITALPLYILQKIIQLDDSEFVPAAIIYALCAGLSVEALTSGIDPRQYFNRAKKCPPGINRLLAKQLEKLKEIGVQLTSLREFTHKSDKLSGARRLITASDVKRAGGTIAISSQDVVTPLARDLIKSMKKDSGN